MFFHRISAHGYNAGGLMRKYPTRPVAGSSAIRLYDLPLLRLLADITFRTNSEYGKLNPCQSNGLAGI